MWGFWRHAGAIILTFSMLASIVSPNLVSASETSSPPPEENFFAYLETPPLELQKFLAGEFLTFEEIQTLLDYENLPPELRTQLEESMNYLENFPPELRDKLLAGEELTPEEFRKVLSWENLSPEIREQLEQQASAYLENLPPEVDRHRKVGLGTVQGE